MSIAVSGACKSGRKERERGSKRAEAALINRHDFIGIPRDHKHTFVTWGRLVSVSTWVSHYLEDESI